MFNISDVTDGVSIVAVFDGNYDLKKLNEKFIPNPNGKYFIVELTDKPNLKTMLINLGITGNYSAADYISDAVSLGLKDWNYLEMITKLLYPEIAKKYNTTVSRVERAIRVAIEATWDICDVNYRKRVFGCLGSPGMTRPSNMIYLKCLVRYLM